MRIALVTDGIWPYVLGGMQKHSYYLCKFLAASGVHVDLVHFNRSAYDIGKLEFFTAEERSYIRSIIVPFPAGRRFPGHYLFRSRQYSRRAYEAIADQLPGYDFIYTKGFTGWWLLRHRPSSAPPVGVNFHGYEMFQPPPDGRSRLQQLLLRGPVRRISRAADVVFSYGGHITPLIESLTVPRDRIFELPSGVEDAMIAGEVRKGGGTPRFVFLGRFERRKGVEELNDALRELLRKGVTFHMTFIGPIPQEHQVTNPKVSYAGEVRDRGRLLSLLRENDVLICPSHSEGMPNVILEAMASGLAVVATDVGATRELVNDRTGWLLTSPDPAVIAHAMLGVIAAGADGIFLKKKAAWQLVTDQFRWQELIGRLIRLIAREGKKQRPTGPSK